MMYVSFHEDTLPDPSYRILSYNLKTSTTLEGNIMPELMINIPVQQVATIINSMNDEEMETLLLLLSEEGRELVKRTEDFKNNRVKYLSRDQVFDV